MNAAFIENLRAPELPVRLHTVEVLAASGAYDSLVAALRHDELEVRWRAVVALGWLGDKRAIDVLAALLPEAPYEIKINVVWALGQIGDTRAVETLLALIHAEDALDPDVAYNAALALLRLGQPDPLRHNLERASGEYAFRVAHAALASWKYWETS